MPPDTEMYSTRPDVLIAVMGPAGSGKTSVSYTGFQQIISLLIATRQLINLATGTDGLMVGHGLESCTNNVDAAEAFELDGFRVRLFDTPAFDHTQKTEKEVLALIASALESQFRAGQQLAGIVYTHKISDNRIDKSLKANFEIFTKLCGESSMPNVTIVTTMWSQVSREQGGERVARLVNMAGFFKDALDNNARLCNLFEETTDCTHEIIREMLRNRPAPLRIQREIVSEGLPIDETRAAKEIAKRFQGVDTEGDRLGGELSLVEARAQLARQTPEYQRVQSLLERDYITQREAKERGMSWLRSGRPYAIWLYGYDQFLTAKNDGWVTIPASWEPNNRRHAPQVDRWTFVQLNAELWKSGLRTEDG